MSPPFASPVLRAAMWLLLLSVAMAPLAFVDVPPLIDYPNHLARVFILANFHHLPALRGNYRLDWGVKPNLAMDLLCTPLCRWLPLPVAGRVFLGSIFLVLISGTAALARSLHGRAGLLPMLAVPLCYNLVFASGFVNFLFGCGLMLLALAAWVRTDHWSMTARGATFAAVTVALFFAHLFPFAAFYTVAGAYEGGRWIRRRDPRSVRAAGALILSLVPAAILWGLKPDGPPRPTLIFGSAAGHVGGLLAPVMFDGGRADLAMLLAAISLAVGVLITTRGRPFDGRMLWPLATLLALALIMPATVMGGHGVSLRFPILLAFLAAASLRPEALPQKVEWPLFALLLAATALRGVETTNYWRPIDRDFREYRAAARIIPAGARVLPFHDDPGSHRPYQHMVDLAVLDRCVFIPHLAKIADQQPLAPAAANKAVDSGTNGEPVDAVQFAQGANPATSAALLAQPHDNWEYPYYANWPKNFDYVVHLDWGRHGNPRPDLLKTVSTGSFFEIFRVIGRPPVKGGGCGGTDHPPPRPHP